MTTREQAEKILSATPRMNLFSRRPAVDAMELAICAQGVVAIAMFASMIWILSGAAKCVQ
jgi:hypothetical protein